MVQPVKKIIDKNLALRTHRPFNLLCFRCAEPIVATEPAIVEVHISPKFGPRKISKNMKSGPDSAITFMSIREIAGDERIVHEQCRTRVELLIATARI